MNFIQKHKIKIGLSIWLLWTIMHLPHPLDNTWGKMLVLFAPLVIVPIVLGILEKYKLPIYPSFFSHIKQWHFPAALSFAAAYFFPQNIISAMLSLPWLFFSGYIAWCGFYILFSKKRNIKWSGFAIASGMIYLFIGGIWVGFGRLGYRPLGFDPEIVFLTVAHFHYAGFVLPIIAGLTMEKTKAWFGKMVNTGIVSGIFLVAIGITYTYIGGSPKVETYAAWWLALSAILLAGTLIYFAAKKGCPPRAAIFWALAGISLLAGMILAGLYGMRHIYAVPGLDIAWMRALHGSANVFGFSLFAVLGWREYYAN